MKKNYCLKKRKKKSQKKLRKKSGRRESPVFCIKIIRQKFAFLKISSILKTETEKRTRKAKSKKQKAKGVVEVQILSSHSWAIRLYRIFVLSLFGRTGGYDLDSCRFCCVRNMLKLYTTSNRFNRFYFCKEEKNSAKICQKEMSVQ